MLNVGCRLKQDKVLVDSIGPCDNVLCITPPMCFTVTDAHHVVGLVDKYLKEIESGACPEQLTAVGESLAAVSELHIPTDVLLANDPMTSQDSDSDEEGPSSSKRMRFAAEDDVD